MRIEEGVIKGTAPAPVEAHANWFDPLIRKKPPHPPATKDITYRWISPDAPEGQKLPVIVLAGGFGSCLDRDYMLAIMPKIAETGASVIGFNYSETLCKQDSVDTSKLNCENALDDLKRVVAFTREREDVDMERMALAGISFGSNRVLALEDDAFKGRILMSCVPDMIKPFKEHVTPMKEKLWRIKDTILGQCIKTQVGDHVQAFSYKLYEQTKKTDMRKLAERVQGPVTIINGGNDPLALQEDVKNLGDMMTHAAVNINFIPGAGHKFRANPLDGAAESEFDVAVRLTKAAINEMLELNKQEVCVPEETQKRPGFFQRLFGGLSRNGGQDNTTRPAFG